MGVIICWRLACYVLPLTYGTYLAYAIYVCLASSGHLAFLLTYRYLLPQYSISLSCSNLLSCCCCCLCYVCTTTTHLFFFSFFSSSSLASIRYLRLSTLCVVVDVLYLFFLSWVWVCFAYSLSLLLFLDVHVHVHDHGRFGRGKLEREREEEGRKTDVAVESVLGEGTSGGEGGERVRLEKPVAIPLNFSFILFRWRLEGGRGRRRCVGERESEARISGQLLYISFEMT